MWAEVGGDSSSLSRGLSWLPALPGKLLLATGSAGAAGQALRLLHVASLRSWVGPLKGWWPQLGRESSKVSGRREEKPPESREDSEAL